MLHTLTKDEVVSLFKTHVHHSSPNRAKLAVHLKAQKPRPKRMSEAATIAFVETVQGRGVVVDEAKWREELFAHGEPTLTQATEYWNIVLKDEPRLSEVDVKTLLDAIPKLSESSPASSDYEGTLREGVSLITDSKQYRSTLRLTDLPKPVVEWGDLPVSKF